MKESEKARLRGRGQLLEPTVRLGRQGVSAEFLSELNRCLDQAELVKIKFGEFKQQRKILAPQIASQSNSALVGMVGHTALFFRRGKLSVSRGEQTRTNSVVSKPGMFLSQGSSPCPALEEA